LVTVGSLIGQGGLQRLLRQGRKPFAPGAGQFNAGRLDRATGPPPRSVHQIPQQAHRLRAPEAATSGVRDILTARTPAGGQHVIDGTQEC
jgi:hypothetical protein